MPDTWLTLLCTPSLEEKLIDHLLVVTGNQIFTSTPVAAHGLSTAALNPMERVMGPLRQFGTVFQAQEGGLLPVTVHGSEDPMPITYELTVASAQVKSAVLLAGLNTPGKTTVIEPIPTRDHTENMLRHFGAEVVTQKRAEGGNIITLTGQPELTPADIQVPSDVSSAAFPLVAASIVPGSDITVSAVGLNPLRAGLIDTLIDMGADLTVLDQRVEGGEPVGDIRVKASNLHGIDVPPERAPSMIDEYPVLAVAASCATGTTRMTGIGELRVKESDRLQAMVDGLTAAGVTVRHGDDWMEIDGNGTPPRGGMMATVDLDHRIGMSFLVLGMVTEAPVDIDDGAAIATSFPGFVDLMNGLGADILEL